MIRKFDFSSVFGFAVFAAVAAPAIAGPDLVARVDGTEVPSFGQVQFEDLLVGQTQQIVVVLRNEGDEDLIFNETPPVQLTTGFTDFFSIIQPALEAGNKLSPGASTAFAIRFEPESDPGIVLSANTFIFTNEAAQPYRINFRGDVVSPELFVSQNGVELEDAGTFDFGAVRVGERVEAEFVIENTGDGAMTLTGNPRVDIAGGLGATVMEVLNQPNGIVQPGASTSFTVAFEPTNDQPFPTRMFIATSVLDANGNEILFDLDLLGEGFILDCNQNGVDDAEDIANGDSEDCNFNGEPDECELDSDNDGVIDDCDAFPNDPTDGQGNENGNENGNDNGHDDNGNQNDNGDVDDGNLNDNGNDNQNDNGNNDDNQNDNGNDNGIDDDFIDDNANDNGNNDQQDDDDQAGQDVDDEDQLDDMTPLVPAPCGFGMTGAAMMCMMSLAGGRKRFTKVSRS
ncbi:MAG: choice-of-anchor D domain-containing protein [Phycisphaerae bacterium]